MKISVMPSFAAALLFGCATTSEDGQRETIMTFAEVESNLGSLVILDGIVSQTHGAAGLYFNRGDLVDENARCILPQPFGDMEHGKRAKISGRLERTDCGQSRICTNVCDRFVLIRQ